MWTFWHGAALAMITVILTLTLKKQNGEMAVLLLLAASVLLTAAMTQYLQPVVGFLRNLQQIGQVDGQMVGTLFKVVGISLVGQIAGLICADSGNAALGKLVELLAAAVILSLSVPMLTALMEMVVNILGSI